MIKKILKKVLIGIGVIFLIFILIGIFAPTPKDEVKQDALSFKSSPIVSSPSPSPSIIENEITPDGQKPSITSEKSEETTTTPSKKAAIINDEPTKTPVPKTSVVKVQTPTPNQHKYVGSSESKKYHLPTCWHVDSIDKENLIYFSSIQDAKNQGYSACKTCNPK